MNVNESNNMNADEEFADLLDKSLSDISNEFYEPGQLVNAQIVKITEEWIFLNIGSKSEGYLETAEITDENGNISVNEGESIKVFFLSTQEGELHFTTKITEGKIGQKIVQNAFENGETIQGYVNKEIKGGYEVMIGTLRAFCPYSQMGLERENPEKFVGQKMQFRITDFEENGRNIIISNRVLLEEERKLKIESLRDTLMQGMKIKGTVKSVQNFGAFVDIGGIQGLIPISEISRGRIENINDYIKTGQEIEAVILNLDWDNEKVSLSIKEMLPDPWETADKKYTAGNTYSGKIARLTNFGAFVTLEPGLDGMVHISDLGGNTRIKHPREVVKEGDSLDVIIDKVDANKKRISLKVLRTAEENENDDYGKFMGKKDDTYNPFGNLGNLLKNKDKA